MTNEAQMRAEFLKSVIALGLDRTYDGKRFVNQRTDDTWRGYKFAMSNLPCMTEKELVKLLDKNFGDFQKQARALRDELAAYEAATKAEGGV